MSKNKYRQNSNCWNAVADLMLHIKNFCKHLTKEVAACFPDGQEKACMQTNLYHLTSSRERGSKNE